MTAFRGFTPRPPAGLNGLVRTPRTTGCVWAEPMHDPKHTLSENQRNLYPSTMADMADSTYPGDLVAVHTTREAANWRTGRHQPGPG